MYSLHDELHQGNTYLRNKEARNNHLTSILDIKSYTKENSTYYFVGTIGNGMQSTILTACIIREIIPYADSQPIFNQLLPLMNVDFIRNGQLTVIPFPFKYLSERVEGMRVRYK
ncbi:MAG: hypothetical protein R3Y57_06055 [Erysipelotrichaceae bacterium]